VARRAPILDGGKARTLYAFLDTVWSQVPHRVRGVGHRHQACRMLTERLAASPHARDQAAPSCPICAAGKPAVR